MGAFFYCLIGEARRERERERVGAVLPFGWLVVRCLFFGGGSFFVVGRWGRAVGWRWLCAWAWGSPLLGSLPLLFFPLAARLVSAPWLRCAVWGCLFAALPRLLVCQVSPLAFPRASFLTYFIIIYLW
jgi:hypothetical protein